MDVINFEIIIVYEQDAPEVDYDIKDVLIPIANAQISNITEANPIKTDIMAKLLFASDKNSSDVILIIGNIGSVERHLVIEAITHIIDSKRLPQNVEVLLLNIEEKLKDIMSNDEGSYKEECEICGIRNQTLIVNLSGPHNNPKECLEAIMDMIVQVIHLIRTNKDQSVQLHNVTSISDNDSTEQKKALKRCKESTFSFDLPLNLNTVKRHKESFPIISRTDAMLKIHFVVNRNIKEQTSETVQLSDAYGRILYEIVEAAYDVPSFKASTKHGYAVLVTDGKGLRKVLDVKNTFPSMSLEPGTCVWVKSGAPIPNEATAVVSVKDTKLVNKSKSSDDTYIEIMIQPQCEQNIKPIGYDLMKEKTILTPHMRIGPTEIALLAASGRKEVLVVKHKSIGVLSIGSNLQQLEEEPLKPGFVYDINRITLMSLLKEKGFHSLDFGIVDNKLVSIQNKVGEALKKVDLLVTTGSTNDRELLKTVLEINKVDIHFGNVNIKPGKSTIFATCKINNETKYFLCLSGNPVSAHIGAQIFLVPLLNELCCNFHCTDQTVIRARTEQQYTLHSRSRVAWTSLKWTEKEECAVAFSQGNVNSDTLISAVGANALLFLPEKETANELPESSFPLVLLVKFPKRFNN